MKNHKKLNKPEEHNPVLKRCVSTYKQEFLLIDKLNNIKPLSSASDREINHNPIYNTHDNLENMNSNDQKDKNNIYSIEKRAINKFNNEKESLNKNIHYNKKKKLDGFLFQSSIRRNFSPQILKTKIDFNYNSGKRNPFTNKNSYLNQKTNSSNFDNNNNNYLRNNESTKDLISHLNSINNSLNQNISLKKLKSKILNNLSY